MSDRILILIIIFLYLLFMLAIGVYSNKKSIKNSEDYLVAGKRLSWWLLLGSLAATEIGAGSTMGVAQKAYGDWGLSSVWYIWTMGISFLVVAFVAPRLRDSNVVTVPQFFLEKYDKANHLVTSIIMFIPLIGLTAVQMIATAMIFSTVTGIDYQTSALISCGIIIAYTVMGGMWSVSLTDFWQFLLIAIGMTLSLPFAIHKSGGWDAMISCIPAEKLSLVSGMGVESIISLIVVYVTSMLIGQEVTQRLYSGKDKKNIIAGSLATSLFYFLFAFVPPFLGLSIYALQSKGIIDSSLVNNFSDMYVLPTIAIHVLPPVIVGLLFVGLVSATMSSASSDLLGAASILTNDIYFQYFKKESDDQARMKLIRILVGVIGVISLVIAILNPEDVIKILIFSFSLRAAGGFFPYILRHYTDKITPLASLLSLIIPSLILLYLEITKTKIFGFEPIIPALIVSFIIIIFVSKIPSKQVQSS